MEWLDYYRSRFYSLRKERRLSEGWRRRGNKNFQKTSLLLTVSIGRGWSAFTPEKPLVIVKLEKTAEEIGLKSP